VRNYVAAPVLAGAYPAAHKWDSKRCLVHQVEIDSDRAPVSVRCGGVKVESISDDSAHYNAKAVSCPRCLKLILRGVNTGR